MRIFTLVPTLLLVLVMGSGCEKEASSTDTASSVEGLLALDTFTATPTEVAAIDESGGETTS